MSIKAPKNKLILDRIEPNNISSKGVLLPSGTKYEEIKGTIISAGEETGYVVNQIVFFDPAPARPFIYREKVYWSITPEEVLGVEEQGVEIVSGTFKL